MRLHDAREQLFLLARVLRRACHCISPHTAASGKAIAPIASGA
jgi:hypothetical protein